MQFTVAVNGQCGGGNHVHLTVSAGAQSRQITLTRADLAVDFSSLDAVRDTLAILLRSRIKEAGATTPAQIKAAIESKAFYL